MEGDLDMTGEINWDTLFLDFDFPDFENILENSSSETETVTQPPPPQPLSTPSPDDNAVVSSCIGEIEKVLMEDDDPFDDDGVEIQPVSDEFFADILVDSPVSGSGGEVTDDAGSPKQNNTDTHIDNDDPVSKKQRRMLRNRDAAVRSRERKKTYVKDLEMKSKYLEGECRRLNRTLQCFIAENQALRFTLNKGSCAFDASSAKQESAVLLLESLLLGSLLWFLGIMCLLKLPTLPKSLVEAVPLENKEKRGPKGVAPRESGNRLVGQSLMKSRRCKASRSKMKDIFLFLEFWRPIVVRFFLSFSVLGQGM